MTGPIAKAIARTLDATALKAYQAGTRIAGERGGHAADTVTGIVLGPLREAVAEPCFFPEIDHDHDK